MLAVMSYSVDVLDLVKRDTQHIIDGGLASLILIVMGFAKVGNRR